jgi:hypothetical protein
LDVSELSLLCIHAIGFKTIRASIDMGLPLAFRLRLRFEGSNEIILWTEQCSAYRTDPRTRFIGGHLENLFYIYTGSTLLL